MTYPVTSSTAAEWVGTGYNTSGLPVTLTNYSGEHYVDSTSYNNDGTLQSRTLGTGANAVFRSYSWEPTYGRLATLTAAKGGPEGRGGTQIQSLTCDYKPLGDLNSITDSVRSEKQCFGYDNWRRLTSGFTTSPSTACSAQAPTTGAGAYNDRYTYDDADRITSFGAASGANGQNTYTYGASRPHAVNTIATPAGNKIYTYDNSGNRATYKAPDGTVTTYAWDADGRITSAVAGVPAGATPSHRATASGPTGAAAAPSMAISRPAGTVSGDFLVAVLVTAGTTTSGTPATVTAPAGWTQAATTSQDGISRTTIYTRTAASTDPTNWTFTFSASVKAAGGISAYAGTSGIDVAQTGANTTSTTSHINPAVVTTGKNRRVITITGLATATSATSVPDKKRLDAAASTGSPTVTAVVADKAYASAGSTGAFTITSAAATASTAITLALKPTVPGTTPQTTSNVYGIDRQRILRKDPDGSVTLFVAGLMEFRKPANGGIEPTTYYAIAGTSVAIRRPASLEWILGDEHGSASLTVNNATGEIRRQYYTPYGNPRLTTTSTNGATPTPYAGQFASDRAYLNQTRDSSTSLNYLNNRHMDSSTGTFLSVDPLVAKTGQPYLYGSGNPITFSDPSGLSPEDACRGTNQQAGGACARATYDDLRSRPTPTGPKTHAGSQEMLDFDNDVAAYLGMLRVHDRLVRAL